MPLNLPDKLPAIELLKEENIFVIDTSRATQQDIRPLRIVILNLMPTKIETELGWEPQYVFDTGMKQTIQWYLDNKEWWEHIINGEYTSYFEKMYGERL